MWRLRKDRFRLKKHLVLQSRISSSRLAPNLPRRVDKIFRSRLSPRHRNTIAPEDQNSHRIAESEQTDIKAEEPSEDVEVAQVPIPIEEAACITKQITRFEDGAEPEEREAVRSSWAWLYPEELTTNEFAYPHLARQRNRPSRTNRIFR